MSSDATDSQGGTVLDVTDVGASAPPPQGAPSADGPRRAWAAASGVEKPSGASRRGHDIPAARRRTGLLALTVGFVALALAVGVARGLATSAMPGRAASTPSAASSYAPDPTIPAEARTKLYSSTQAASGQYTTAGLTIPAVQPATKINSYTVKVETSLNTDPAAVARFVQETLDDPRGWVGYGKNAFSLVPTDAQGQLTIILASPQTVDTLCGASVTKGLWDCRVDNRIVLNSDRWFYMTPTYASLTDYRVFMINHEIGLFLGQKVTTCRSKGAKAPVMMPQGAALGGCVANPWPRV